MNFLEYAFTVGNRVSLLLTGNLILIPAVRAHSRTLVRRWNDHPASLGDTYDQYVECPSPL